MLESWSESRPNARQQEALDCLGRAPLRIIAGPGTGKTATVVEMYLTLVESDKLNPSDVLLLTFSRNAAAELQRRIDQRFRRSYAESWVSTFHSFAYRIVREYSPPGSRDRRLMNGFQEKLLMRAVLNQLTARDCGSDGSSGLGRLFESQMLAQDVLWLISSLKQELIRPEEFSAWVEELRYADGGVDSITNFVGDSAKLGDLARIYSAYLDEQGRLGLADFRDVIAQAVSLLEDNDEIRAKLANKFRYVIVDEYQDVDGAQVRLIDNLTRDHPGFRHLAVVGDGNQSIYSFRGTSPAFLETNWRFGGQTVTLTENYRSYASILSAAERLGDRFGFSSGSEPAQTRAGSGRDPGLEAPPDSSTGEQESNSCHAEIESSSGVGTLIAVRGNAPWPAVQIRHEVTAADEAAGVARLILQLTKPVEEGGAAFRHDDIAIVLRSVRRTGREFEDALQAAGIPHDIGVSPNFAASDVVRFAVSALRALAEPDTDEHLLRILESPLCGVPTPDARRLMAEANRRRQLERETLKEKSLRTVLNHSCYLMADEDDNRWPLPWGKPKEEEQDKHEDPLALVVDPTPAPAADSPAEVDRQQTVADDIEREADRDDPNRPQTVPHPFYQLLSEQAKDAIHRFCGRWGVLRSVVDRISPDVLLYRIFQDLDVIGKLMHDAARNPLIEVGAVLGPLRMLNRAVTELVEFQQPLLGRAPRLTEVIESLEPALREYVDELEPTASSGTVRVLTVHGAKGLEFPVVFVPGMAAGRLPVTPRPRTPLLTEFEANWLAEKVKSAAVVSDVTGTAPLPWILDEHEFLKEEARLAYVAGTRAQDMVVYSWADSYGDDETAEPSAFLQSLANASGLDLNQISAVQGAAFIDRSELHQSPSFQDAMPAVDMTEAATFLEWKPWSSEPLRPAPDLHLSASSVTKFLACSRKFYYSKLLDLRPQVGVAAARGSAFHAAMQMFHDPATEDRWRKYGKEAEDVKAIYDECCDTALQTYLALVDGHLEKKQEEQLLRRLFDNYWCEHDGWAGLTTKATEAQFQWVVDGQLVLGYIDRIIETDAGIEIVDYKTGSDKTARKIECQLGMGETPPTDLQLLIYFFALEEGSELRLGGRSQLTRFDVAAISLWYPKRVLTKHGKHIRKVGIGDGPSLLSDSIEYIDINDRRQELRAMVAEVFQQTHSGSYAAEPKHDEYTCASVFGSGCEFQWLCPGRVAEPAGYEVDV